MQVGFDVGATKIESVVLEKDGQERHRSRIPCPKDYTQIITAIRDIHRQLEQEFKQELPIGVCHPGVHSPQTGLVKNAPNITWLEKKPFQNDLRKALGKEVFCENDANCFALSEAYDGAGSKHEIVFGVIIGTGVGGGLVINKKIINGFNNITGEWGHNQMPVGSNDKWNRHDCYCGKKGCIETFLSGPGFSKHFYDLFNEKFDAKIIQEKANNGDEKALEFIFQYLDYLARGLAQVINIIDPGAIVLGGGVSNMKQIYGNINAKLKKYVFSDTVNTEVIKNKFGDSSGVRGAADLGRETT